MRLYFDSEFTGLRQDSTLISIGFIDEEGKTFYAEFTDYDKSQVDDWVIDNVISNLKLIDKINKDEKCYINKFNNNMEVCGNTNHIKNMLKLWLSKYDNVEIWSDCLSYDWVLFNNIFGGAFSIPKNVYYIPFDICTVFKIKDIDPDINREEFVNRTEDINSKHNALYDAIIIKECYDKLMRMV